MLTPSNQYLQAVEEINDYVNQAKCRASVSVNNEIMKTNIFIGNVIIRNSEWGNKFVENLSKDMKMRFPSAKGYSVRNLKYMKKFAQIFTEDDIDEYGLGRITWSHHQILMSKVSNREEYIWYLEKTLEHKWSVDDLTSQVKSQLYERQAVANKISNFERRLPAEQKDMVLSTMKDPYMFDFIDYTEEMLETDIENELVKNVTSLLMELGTGFAFMGQQYHLEGKHVIGHVGRFMAQKNHTFLLDVFAAYKKEDKDAYLVLLGDGELMETVKNKAKELGVADSVLFVGNVGNANEWYQAFDVFMLPSIWEGLPVVGVEAQAADLPCIFSDNVTKEIGLSDKASFLSLHADMSSWVSEIRQKMQMTQRVNQEALITENHYNIEKEAVLLQERYLKLYGENTL